jgi:hypothetical protein
LLTDYLKLEDSIKAKALERAKIEGLDKDKKLLDIKY